MKIDGYTPPSKEVAFEQGVTFEYPIRVGNVTIRAKMAGRDNVSYRLAISNHAQWQQRRNKLGNVGDDVEAENKFLGIIYDHLVISWETTITAEGKPIAATKENFISLMKHPSAKGLLDIFIEDATDENNFRELSAEEMAGNSVPPSDGN